MEVRTAGNPGDIPGNSGEILGKFGQPISRPMKPGVSHEIPESRKAHTATHAAKSHDTRRYQRTKCGGKTRGTGQPCRKWAMIGRTRCRLHGGKTLRGPDHPNWKGGFYSVAFPEDVAKLARQAAADPELRDLRSLIGVLDLDILNTVKQTQGGRLSWAHALTALDALKSAGDDLNAARKALDGLDAAIRDGAKQERAWDRLWELAGEKSKLLSDEVTRHKATADTINADRVATFMIGMMDALREESGGDRDLLRRVFHRWERLMGMAGVTAPADKATT